MLNTRLQQVWDAATPSQREGSTLAAKHVLENLVHYPSTRTRLTDIDDVEMVAAELLAWYAEGCPDGSRTFRLCPACEALLASAPSAERPSSER
jgi:hypothetical protein